MSENNLEDNKKLLQKFEYLRQSIALRVRVFVTLMGFSLTALILLITLSPSFYGNRFDTSVVSFFISLLWFFGMSWYYQSFEDEICQIQIKIVDSKPLEKKEKFENVKKNYNESRIFANAGLFVFLFAIVAIITLFFFVHLFIAIVFFFIISIIIIFGAKIYFKFIKKK